jgi:UDP-N-acetylglucosamine kinase
MNEYKPLSAEEVREIAAKYFQERQAKSVPQEQPTMVLVGGQPGAGKSAAAAAVRGELAQQGGYIHVDADRMREQIRIGNTKPTSEQTQADAGRLVQSLRLQATENRRNIVEEGTYRNPEGAAKFVEGIKAKGYSVEMLAVATSREESLLGIHQRYEMQHAAGAPNPRFVPEKYHDEALQGFDNTIARGSFDRIRVVNRDGDLLFDSRSAHNSQGSALEALAENRKISDARLPELVKAWGAVEKAATDRNAPSDYLASVSGNAKRLQDMQSERIHAYAMSQVNRNVTALSADDRYSKHTNSELLKAAYFRGFHEKACEFKGIKPDFAKYDNTVSSKSALGQLPEVEGLAGKSVQRNQRTREDDGHSL